MKDYPEIVRDSLILSLEQLLDNKIIDLTTYELMKDRKEDRHSFEDYLLTKKDFTKTEKELFEEYEVFRNELDEELKEHELYDLKTETIVKEDSIYVLKTFLADEEFVMDYFGVEELDLIKLMRRKEFIEKFAVLRFTKILKDIIDKVSYKISILEVDNSLVYFNETYNGYGIDLIMKASISDVSVLDKRNKIIVEIKDINEIAGEIFKQKALI